MGQIFGYPGFIDVHVHFRDPGDARAETSASGLASAREGGFAAVVVMPNTTPAGDSVAWVRQNLALRGPEGQRVFPSACLTEGRLGKKTAQLEKLAEAGAVFFTDDGTYVEDDAVMEDAMRRAARLGIVVCQHAMTWKGRTPGVIRDCPLAHRLGLPVVDPQVETDAIRRDLSICRVTGCALHVQHLSTAEGVALVRAAQKEGLPVTAEATPHHLLFACEELTADDANYKMAPPLGTREDRAELRKAVKDGVLMFATDHAPHPAETKNRGFAKSANGIIGLETAVAITYKVMVEEERMPRDDWAAAWTEMPRRLFPASAASALVDLPATRIEVGVPRVWHLAQAKSLSRNCPYDGFAGDCWPLLPGTPEGGNA